MWSAPLRGRGNSAGGADRSTAPMLSVRPHQEPAECASQRLISSSTPTTVRGPPGADRTRD
jgi:hypothetical protein